MFVSEGLCVIGTRHGQRSGQASTIRCPFYRPRTARICFGMICVGEGIYNLPTADEIGANFYN